LVLAMATATAPMAACLATTDFDGLTGASGDDGGAASREGGDGAPLEGGNDGGGLDVVATTDGAPNASPCDAGVVHTICEDFTDPDAGARWTQRNEPNPGAESARSPSTFFSGPAGLRASVPALATPSDYALAYWMTQLARAFKKAHLEIHARVTPAPTSASSVTIAEIITEGRSLSLVVEGAQLVFTEGYAAGTGTMVFQTTPAIAPFPADVWHAVTMDVDLSAAVASAHVAVDRGAVDVALHATAMTAVNTWLVFGVTATRPPLAATVVSEDDVVLDLQ
jgi:hypothetical protein